MAKTIDVRLINPFIDATLECLKQMAGLDPRRLRLFVKTDATMHGEITGVIGLSKGITGSCSVSFPRALAERIVGSFLGEQPPLADAMITDGIGEVANMVAGGAKRRFADQGFSFSISTPTIITGTPTKLLNPQDILSVAVEFQARPDWPETFLVEVASKPTDKAE
jgi:chemotaxis protein CheX